MREMRLRENVWGIRAMRPRENVCRQHGHRDNARAMREMRPRENVWGIQAMRPRENVFRTVLMPRMCDPVETCWHFSTDATQKFISPQRFHVGKNAPPVETFCGTPRTNVSTSAHHKTFPRGRMRDPVETFQLRSAFSHPTPWKRLGVRPKRFHGAANRRCCQLRYARTQNPPTWKCFKRFHVAIFSKRFPPDSHQTFPRGGPMRPRGNVAGHAPTWKRLPRGNVWSGAGQCDPVETFEIGVPFPRLAFPRRRKRWKNLGGVCPRGNV